MNAFCMVLGCIVGAALFLLLNWIEDSPEWQRIEHRMASFKQRITIRR